MGSAGSSARSSALLVVSGAAAGAIAAAIVDDGTVLVMAGAVALGTIAIGGPLLYALYMVMQRRGLGIALESVVQERLMENDARRREFEAKLARALEMADDEVAAFDTVRASVCNSRCPTRRSSSCSPTTATRISTGSSR